MRESTLLNSVIAVRWEWEAASSREKRRSIQESRRILFDHIHKLSEDASDAPNINSRSVVFLKQDKFRSSIPTCNYMACQLSFGSFGI